MLWMGMMMGLWWDYLWLRYDLGGCLIDLFTLYQIISNLLCSNVVQSKSVNSFFRGDKSGEQPRQ